MTTEIAWAAGFFDGEGYCGLSSDGYVSVKIGQIHPEVLERFARAVGHGQVTGPRKVGDNPNWQDLWSYQIGGEPAILVMNLLWPYLSTVKRIQFRVALDNAKRRTFRVGYCRKDLHKLDETGRTTDGKCRLCKNELVRTSRKNGRVSP